MVSTAGSQQEGRGFNFRPETFLCRVWMLSLCVCVGSLRALQLPPTVQRSIGDSKLSVIVKLSATGCSTLSLNCPAMSWPLVQGVTLPSHYDSWEAPADSREPELRSKWVQKNKEWNLYSLVVKIHLRPNDAGLQITMTSNVQTSN